MCVLSALTIAMSVEYWCVTDSLIFVLDICSRSKCVKLQDDDDSMKECDFKGFIYEGGWRTSGTLELLSAAGQEGFYTNISFSTPFPTHMSSQTLNNCAE